MMSMSPVEKLIGFCIMFHLLIHMFHVHHVYYVDLFSRVNASNQTFTDIDIELTDAFYIFLRLRQGHYRSAGIWLSHLVV